MRQLSASALLFASVLLPRVAHGDDKADCIAAFESAQRLREEHKLLQALPELALCARAACPRSLQKECVVEAEESSTLLPSVVLSATDGVQRSIIDATVSVDGLRVATVLDGKAIPVDPGLHTFRFEKAGSVAVERQVAVKEGQKGQLVEVAFADAAAPVQTIAIIPRNMASEPAEKGSMTKMRWAGIGLGAAGIVGLGLGGAYALMAFGKRSDSITQCGAACSPGGTAYATQSAGETDGTISTVAFVVGGALAAAGVVLVVVGAPRMKAPSSLALTPTLGGAELGGGF